MRIIQKPSPNFWDSSEEKTAIILHKGLGTKTGDLSWMNNPISKVSYHYYFPRKGITYYQLVADNHSSWSSGHVIYTPTKLGKTILQKDTSGKRTYLNANRYVYNFGFQGRRWETFTESQMELATWVAKKLGGDFIIGTHKDLVPYKPPMDEYRIELEKRLDGITEHSTPEKQKLIIILKLQLQLLILKLQLLKFKGRK